MGGRDVRRHHAGLILRVGAVIILAALAFYWGLQTGYESARPWELTAYGEYNAEQLQHIMQSLSLNAKIVAGTHKRPPGQTGPGPGGPARKTGPPSP